MDFMSRQNDLNMVLISVLTNFSIKDILGTAPAVLHLEVSYTYRGQNE
jgi:hypothetical protein